MDQSHQALFKRSTQWGTMSDHANYKLGNQRKKMLINHECLWCPATDRLIIDISQSTLLVQSFIPRSFLHLSFDRSLFLYEGSQTNNWTQEIVVKQSMSPTEQKKCKKHWSITRQGVKGWWCSMSKQFWYHFSSCCIWPLFSSTDMIIERER